MARKTYTIFNPTTSPQQGGDSVGAGDGEGTWLKVRTNPANPKSIDKELIAFTLSGSLNGATVKVVVAPELSSPMVKGYALNPQDAGTMVVVSSTVAGVFMAELPSGFYFTLEISSSGSPIPALVASATGEIEPV